MIYSFFDVGPGARKGLGTFIILDHIIRAARAGLPYVYLGYWVEGIAAHGLQDQLPAARSASAATAGRGWNARCQDPQGRARGRSSSPSAANASIC